MIKVSLQGFDGFAERYAKATQKVLDEVDAEIGASTQDMVAIAKRNAPNDQGLLVNEITSRKREPLVWEFVSQASYSSFVEFGTRLRKQVNIPEGLEHLPEVVNATSSLSAKQAIFKWCERNGIERKFWYPIFVRIMTEGISPRPFFFPAFEEVKPQLLNRLNQIL